MAENDVNIRYVYQRADTLKQVYQHKKLRQLSFYTREIKKVSIFEHTL